MTAERGGSRILTREWWRSNRRRRQGQPRCIERKRKESPQLEWNWQEGNDPSKEAWRARILASREGRVKGEEE